MTGIKINGAEGAYIKKYNSFKPGDIFMKMYLQRIKN